MIILNFLDFLWTRKDTCAQTKSGRFLRNTEKLLGTQTVSHVNCTTLLSEIERVIQIIDKIQTSEHHNYLAFRFHTNVIFFNCNIF